MQVAVAYKRSVMAKESVRHLVVGDVVKLNSGGPSMSVELVYRDMGSDDVYVKCIWHNLANGELCSSDFKESNVTRVQGLK